MGAAGLPHTQLCAWRALGSREEVSPMDKILLGLPLTGTEAETNPIASHSVEIGFLILWFIIRNTSLVFVLIPGTGRLKPLTFPKWYKSDILRRIFLKVHFVIHNKALSATSAFMLIRWLLPLQMGAGCQGNQPWSESWNFQPRPPTLEKGRGVGG